MYLFFRIILIALVFAPQGWCRIIPMVETCCNTTRSDHSTENKPSCCCKTHADASCAINPSDHEPKSIPRSCECHCRFQVAVPTAQLTFKVTPLESGLIDPYELELDSRQNRLVHSVSFSPTVTLQILHCSWQC